MQKAELSTTGLVQLRPIELGLFKQRKASLYVGANKGAGIDNRAIYMAFRGEMDDDPGPVFAQQCGHKLRIANIAAHQLMSGITRYLRKIPWIACISEQIKIHHGGA